MAFVREEERSASDDRGPFGRPGVRWENSVHEQGFVPALLFEVATEEDVAWVVRKALREERRVHVAGAGLSSSPLVATDGYLIETGRLSGVVLMPEHEHLADAGHGRCVRVLAGTRLAALNAALDAHGLAMPILGSAALESIAGAVSTGTHGSGVGFGPLADLVRSIDLVDGRGQRWRVEPRAGFTRLGSEPPGVQRKNDDDWFHSVVVGVGVAGIITSLVLEVRDAFDLEERRTLTTWKALVASSSTDADIDRAAHYEIWLNPYADRAGENTALITVRSPAASGAPRRPRPKLRLLSFEPVRQGLALVLDAFPSLVPFALDAALESQLTHAPNIDASHRIFDLGAINHLPAVASEWCFPRSTWKEAVSALLAEAEKMRARPQAVGACPFGVRFIRASPHFLAMSQGEIGERGEKSETVCSIEVPIFSTEHDRRTLQYRYDLLATRLGGRPHWGKHHRPRPARLARRYPKAPRFLAVRSAIDPEERFANQSALAEGFTRHPVPPPVLGAINAYDSSVPRVVLELGAASTPIFVDTRRFDVAASARDVVFAFQDVLQQPGRLVARRFEVLREAGREGQAFAIGERFQGRFALDAQLLEDARPRPSLWARLLRALGMRDVLRGLENQGLSNYGQIAELDLEPAEGRPYSIAYAYLTGTPFAGHSRFTVTPTGPGRCRYVEQLTFQPLDFVKQAIMETIGLRLHNQVVFGQVEAAADWLDVDFVPLDLDGLGTPTGPLP